MVPSASIPAVRQNRSKLTETASQVLSTPPIPVGGKAVNGVIAFFMALLSFRGISTPSLPAQGEQRRSFYFNIPRGNSEAGAEYEIALMKKAYHSRYAQYLDRAIWFDAHLNGTEEEHVEASANLLKEVVRSPE
ncbi:MAG: hypothetical protein ACRECN_03650 [Methylocella sp.]